MKVDIGVLFRSIQRQDSQRVKFGLIPHFAACFLGKCKAESFSERTYRCTKDVLTEGNSLLSDKEMNMVVLLRMNRKFMEHMRFNYAHMNKQIFNLTLSFDEESSEDASTFEDKPEDKYSTVKPKSTGG